VKASEEVQVHGEGYPHRLLNLPNYQWTTTKKWQEQVPS